jgi:hypothetical protein
LGVVGWELGVVGCELGVQLGGLRDFYDPNGSGSRRWYKYSVNHVRRVIIYARNVLFCC